MLLRATLLPRRNGKNSKLSLVLPANRTYTWSMPVAISVVARRTGRKVSQNTRLDADPEGMNNRP